MTRCVIFDIDGTLADHPAVLELARILDQTGNLVFVSGQTRSLPPSHGDMAVAYRDFAEHALHARGRGLSA